MIPAAILALVAGALHGLREAYHAQPDIFEHIIKGTDTDFFGARAWLRRYIGNVVANGPKKVYRFIGVVDFWHVSRWVENLCVAVAIALLTGIWWLGIAYLVLVGLGGWASYSLVRRG